MRVLQVTGGTLFVNEMTSVVEGANGRVDLVGLPVAVAMLRTTVERDDRNVVMLEKGQETPRPTSPHQTVGSTTETGCAKETEPSADGIFTVDENGLYPGQLQGPSDTIRFSTEISDLQAEGAPECKT